MAEPEILFERRGHAGLVTLNRPGALNALSHGMVTALAQALEGWRDDPEIRLVIVRAVGRAFCAGGDIRAVYEAGQGSPAQRAFFEAEYRLNAAIKAFPKPYVALIDGYVMGGGAGISVHGSHRLFAEKAVFAMPENRHRLLPRCRLQLLPVAHAEPNGSLLRSRRHPSGTRRCALCWYRDPCRARRRL